MAEATPTLHTSYRMMQAFPAALAGGSEIGLFTNDIEPGEYPTLEPVSGSTGVFEQPTVPGYSIVTVPQFSPSDYATDPYAITVSITYPTVSYGPYNEPVTIRGWWAAYRVGGQPIIYLYQKYNEPVILPAGAIHTVQITYTLGPCVPA